MSSSRTASSSSWLRRRPDAHELHVHPDGGADEPQLLARDPGGDVQRPVAGAAVELRLVREIVDYDQNLVQFFEAHLLSFSGDLLLLLDDAAQGTLVPFVEVDLLALRVDAHEVLHGLPGIIDFNRRRHDNDSFKDGFTAARHVLIQDG